MTAIPKAKTASWGVIAMLAAAQFIQSLPNRADGAKPADEPAPAGETAAAVNG